jgi:hypothetical protein
MSVSVAAPVTASAARDELEAVILRAATVRDAFGRPRLALPVAAVDAILAAADAYRQAPPDRTGTVHLTGLAGGHTACRFRWAEPDLLLLTGEPDGVSCGACRRSRQYRDATGAAR